MTDHSPPLRDSHPMAIRFRSPQALRTSAAAPAILLLGLCLSCRPAVSILGSTDRSLAPDAENLLGALAIRFGVASRDPRYESMRARLIPRALTPSRLYTDTTVWSSVDSGVRTLSVARTMVGDRYILAERRAVSRPHVPGNSRSVIQLRRIGDALYQWNLSDEVAIGTLRAGDLYSVFEGAVRGLERPSDEIRLDYRTAFPQTTAALGRLFLLDSLRTVAIPDGSTAITVVARLTPERLRATAPRLSGYLDTYVRPIRSEFTLTDASGTVWGTARFRSNILTMKLRAHDGMLQPLTGDLAAMPDSLRLRISFFAKVLIFNVGASNLVADVIPVRNSSVRGWSLRFTREPQWHFPLATSRLLRAPLHRLFTDGGATLRCVIDESVGEQTLLAWNARVVVQESAILRWLGVLGARALLDLSPETERERGRFVSEVLRAVAEDTRHLLPR